MYVSTKKNYKMKIICEVRICLYRFYGLIEQKKPPNSHSIVTTSLNCKKIQL